jgi:hypothetical protein
MANPQDLMPHTPGGELIEPYPLLNPATAGGVLQLLEDNLGSQNFSILNLPRIYVPSGGGLSWRVATLAGEESEKEIEGIVVAWRSARVYWRESYGGGGSGKPPDCSSKDGLTGIGDPGGTCTECPYAQFGSALQPNGQPGLGQACKDIRQLLVLRPDEILPHLLNVPPTSLRAFNQYSMGLLSARISYWGATTKMTLEKATSDGGKPFARIGFRMGKRLGAEEQQVLLPYHKRMKEVLHPSILDVSDYITVEDEPTTRAR